MILNNDTLFGMDFMDSNRCERLTFVENKIADFYSEFDTEEMLRVIHRKTYEKNTCQKEAYRQAILTNGVIAGFHFCQWANRSTFIHRLMDIIISKAHY